MPKRNNNNKQPKRPQTKTKPKAKQHPRKTIMRRPAANIGNSSLAVPRNSTRSKISASSRAMGDSITITGRDFIGTAVVPAGGDIANGILFQKYNVAAPPATRLAQYAGIFSRWHAKRYRYHLTSALPVGTTSGTYVFAQDPDPTRLYVSGAAGNTAAALVLSRGSMGRSTPFGFNSEPGLKQYWEHSVCDLAPSRDYTSLWCVDPDAGAPTPSDRLDLAGQVLLVTAVPGSLVPGTPVASIELEYEVTFYVPRIGSSAIARSSTIRIPTPFATVPKPVLPTVSVATPDGLVNLVIQAVSESKTTFEAVTAPLKDFIPYLAPSRSDRSDLKVVQVYGLPPASYTATVCLYTNTAPTTTPTWFSSTSSHHTGLSAGTSYPNVGGLPTFGPTYPGGANVAPDGVTWNWSEALTLNWSGSSDSARCFQDVVIAPSSLAALPIDFVMWFDLATSGTDLYLDLGTSAIARKVLVPAIRPDGKEMKVEVEDFDHVTPPLYTPVPSTVLGGSRYVKSTSSPSVPPGSRFAHP